VTSRLLFIVLLDLSAAFDNHKIYPLHTAHHRNGTPLAWYGTDRSFRVSWRRTVSKSVWLSYGVPQGSVFDPLPTFSIYAKSQGPIIQAPGFTTTVMVITHPCMLVERTSSSAHSFYNAFLSQGLSCAL